MKKGTVLSVLLLSTIALSGCNNSNSNKKQDSSVKSEKTSKQSKSNIKSQLEASQKSSKTNDSNSSIKKESKSSMSSTSSSNDNHGDRNQITTQEAQNNNQPLDWEPVKNAQDAENLMKQKYGDQGWHTVHGSVGTSSPIYFAEANNNGQNYYVLATGQITQNENDIKPNNNVPWTLNSAAAFYKNMVVANSTSQNPLWPQGSWAMPTNGQQWKEFSNNGKTIKFGFGTDDPNGAFTLTNNGDGTSTFDYGDGKLIVNNHTYLIESKEG